ncbi:hypothetical protein NMY22_g19044 [Coprinellus aureogranulatus]|nr:hypothetical protein NMY22_g19044 [Coprinellus aureogranulatus]
MRYRRRGIGALEIDGQVTAKLRSASSTSTAIPTDDLFDGWARFLPIIARDIAFPARWKNDNTPANAAAFTTHPFEVTLSYLAATLFRIQSSEGFARIRCRLLPKPADVINSRQGNSSQQAKHSYTLAGPNIGNRLYDTWRTTHRLKPIPTPIADYDYVQCCDITVKGLALLTLTVMLWRTCSCQAISSNISIFASSEVRTASSASTAVLIEDYYHASVSTPHYVLSLAVVHQERHTYNENNALSLLPPCETYRSWITLSYRGRKLLESPTRTDAP